MYHASSSETGFVTLLFRTDNVQAPPPGKEVDIGAHHIVMLYIEKYMDYVFSFSGGIFKIWAAAPGFQKMLDVKVLAWLSFYATSHTCRCSNTLQPVNFIQSS